MQFEQVMANQDDAPLKCHCGLPVAERQSWTEKNPGRRFKCCKFYEPETEWRGCKFFRWVDKNSEEWQRIIINQLVLQKKIMEGQLRSLEAEVNDLQGQRRCLLNETECLKLKYKAVKGEMMFCKKDSRNLGGVCTGFVLGFMVCLFLVIAMYIVMY